MANGLDIDARHHRAQKFRGQFQVAAQRGEQVEAERHARKQVAVEPRAVDHRTRFLIGRFQPRDLGNARIEEVAPFVGSAASDQRPDPALISLRVRIGANG